MEACDQHALHALLNKANASAAGGASSSASQVEGAPIQETITLAIQYWPAIAWLISHGFWQDCSLPGAQAWRKGLAGPPPAGPEHPSTEAGALMVGATARGAEGYPPLRDYKHGPVAGSIPGPPPPQR